ncbi:MAG: ATP-binding protein, partial [Rubrivivax sp.]
MAGLVSETSERRASAPPPREENAPQRLQRFLEGGPAGVFAWHRDGTVSEANDRFLALVGHDREDLAAGRIDWHRIAPAGWAAAPLTAHDVEHHADTTSVTAATGAALALEATRKDGSRVPVLFASAAAAVAGDADAPRVGLVIGHGEPLLHAGGANAHEAQQREEHLLAALAHEVRNRLAPIVNGLALLKAAPAQRPAAQEALAMMQRQARSLVRLVGDLLDVTHPGGSAAGLERQPMNAADALRSALDASRPLLEAAGHEAVLHLPRSPLWVLGDSAKLAQALRNLIDNAARYTPSGGRITAEAFADAGAVFVSIADTGRGIAAEKLATVFVPFSHLHDAHDARDPHETPGHGGLGIGLALARDLVRRHGGDIRAFSHGPGRGSRFVVRLPAAPPPLERAERAAARSRNGAEERTAARAAPPPMHLLVVDDNADAADPLRLLPASLGHRVRVARDGAGALAAIAAEPPQLVLLDIGMSGMDG